MFKNPNTDSLLKLLGDREIILYGVVTEICVDCAARGLIKRGYPFTWSRTPSVTSTRTVPTPPSTMSGGIAVACSPPAKCWPGAPIRRLTRTWNSVTIERPASRASHVYEESSTSAGGGSETHP